MDMTSALPADQNDQSPHFFHIPVMGTGFTIDTPLKVARFGISSAISLLDDVLIEQMRCYHCAQAGEPYTAIPDGDPDARAKRITAYLNLLNQLVNRQVEAIRKAPFLPGTEITRYFELLPDGALKREYLEMLAAEDPAVRSGMQTRLRKRIVAGSIDANIITKADGDTFRGDEKRPATHTVASSALRGFALSDVSAAIIFSAGMNQRLYAYAAEFADFLPVDGALPKKRIILKVSDYRSALIQGKFLAKQGLWVSEFRVESGLNCGGHAFSGRGSLLGTVLAEFKLRRSELYETLYQQCDESLIKAGRQRFVEPPRQRITVQGGINTAADQEHLRKTWDVDGAGWGTPFLLVPEVTCVDEAHLRKLAAATARDVQLSNNSPLGVPFWNLRESASENERRRRIASGKPGSPCPKGYGKVDSEFTDQPICRSSSIYQRLKLKQLAQLQLPEWTKLAAREDVMAKSCICHDLAGGATVKYHIDETATPAMCCGPSIVNFKRIATLDEMVGHIYGRQSILARKPRVHMLMRELQLNIQCLRNDVRQLACGIWPGQPRHLEGIKDNLLAQIAYYQQYYLQLLGGNRERYRRDLDNAVRAIQRIPLAAAIRRWTGLQRSTAASKSV